METQSIKPLLKNSITPQPKAADSCCGGAPVSDESACCKLDEEKKAKGASGCGCQSKSSTSTSSACCG